MIQSSDPQGLCYVETANLDGETNLKVKSAAAVGLESGAASSVGGDKLASRLVGTRIECEAPNNQLYKFEGKWVGIVPPAAAAAAAAAGKKSDEAEADLGLSVDNILLRGSTLRNTEWLLGVVVFTGADSKLMRNMTRAPMKMSQLERHMNLLVMSIGIFQSFCGILLAVLQEEWFKSENTSSLNHWYLLPTYVWPDMEGGANAAVTQFVRYVVLLNALIPISLYVTLELVKVGRWAKQFTRNPSSAPIALETRLVW
jgi:phospholipid-transporting ATPase